MQGTSALCRVYVYVYIYIYIYIDTHTHTYIPESMRNRRAAMRCHCRLSLSIDRASDAAAATSGLFAISAVCNLTLRYELDAISVGVSVAPH